MTIDTLCFSAGGIQGISFIGALLYLEKNNYLNFNNINNFVGTSCGAILAFMLSINYKINELYTILIDNIKYIEPECNIDNFFINYGIDNGDNFYKILSIILEKKLYKQDITFIELYKLTNKKLIIIGTNFTLSKEQIFSYEKTPNISVITAIRISISIPLIFTPILLNKNYYVDGALVNKFPINLCNSLTTIGFKISDSKKLKLNSLQDMIYGTIYIMSQQQLININNYNYVEIKILDNNICNFNVNKKYINNLIKNGKIYAKKYLINIYKKKILKLKHEIKDNSDKKIIKQVLDNIINNIINF